MFEPMIIAGLLGVIVGLVTLLVSLIILVKTPPTEAPRHPDDCYVLDCAEQEAWEDIESQLAA